jgi:CHAP domain/Putative peptidoglycan binding domain
VTTVDEFVKHCNNQVGFTSKQENHTPWNDRFHAPGSAWCAMFVYCMYEDVGLSPGIRSDSVPAIWSWARAHGLVIPSTRCQPGDQIIFDWTGAETAITLDTHTGIVVGRSGAEIHTVEGNVGHDQVLAKTWVAGGRLIAGCVSWQYLFGGNPTAVGPQPLPAGNRFAHFPELRTGMHDVGGTGVFPDLAHPVATLQNAINIATKREGANRLLTPDGDFGGDTEKAVRDFQAFCRIKNPSLAVNGVADARTWALLDFFLDLAGR